MAGNSNLSIRDLRAGYGNLDILNGVDLDVPAGQFVALMGPNGAGKSTLLKTLYGMTTIKQGNIDWRGKNIAGNTSRAILGEGISFVPQGRCNFPVMTVDENLQMAAYTIRDVKVKADRDYVYDLFPILKKRRATLAGNMSGGEQQLLEVAMAVLQRPKVLLVDEPSVGLSPAAIGIVFDELLRLHADGMTILLVEQNTKKAMEVAQRAVILRLGKVIWDGLPKDITHDELGELFLTGKMRGETEAVH
ncbi:branched-chain amino acid ABC transporter ATP-binding protein [Rhizobium anhuiense]|uniref:ABC transporter ATP-binding protein n=1 Tax=Rhizobium anhuiense TaxID=1184720 RepID=A0A432NLY4_9HYPH|nr:ABC transporter ATP-binding protein [Rhizobium anhuiense]RUM00523.1 ABC transporter ATP-binding protein [Rhizobium anhuiense]UTS94087.1 ABC transporter ATP-binding protein [Rhizobium anhuiense bv. trifolii]GGD87478.1 ABC transporter ATP-binding protein [Rhizobium anhuiense]